MKKLMLAAIAIFGIFAGLSEKAHAQQGFSLSVKGTPNFSILDADLLNSLNKKATFKANFGVGAEYNITDNYGVGMDLLYALQGQKYRITILEVQQKLSYIKVPVYFSYYTDPSKTASFYGKVGPQFNFLTSARYTGFGLQPNNKFMFKDVVIGAMVNAGVQFRLSEQLALQTGLYFDYDLSNAVINDVAGVNINITNAHNMNAGLQVGLKYSF
jgi:hypothetical protein